MAGAKRYPRAMSFPSSPRCTKAAAWGLFGIHAGHKVDQLKQIRVFFFNDGLKCSLDKVRQQDGPRWPFATHLVRTTFHYGLTAIPKGVCHREGEEGLRLQAVVMGRQTVARDRRGGRAPSIRGMP